MGQSSKGSHPRRSDAGNHEFTCSGCGTKYIAKSSGCPACKSNLGRRGDDELTKKVEDDSDLFK